MHPHYMSCIPEQIMSTVSISLYRLYCGIIPLHILCTNNVFLVTPNLYISNCKSKTMSLFFRTESSGLSTPNDRCGDVVGLRVAGWMQSSLNEGRFDEQRSEI